MSRLSILLTLAAAGIAACGDGATTPRHQQSLIEILPESAATSRFRLGDTIRLGARRLTTGAVPVQNDTAVRFIWTSSDTTILIVDSTGLARIVALGSASATVRVADGTNPAIASTTDTARASIELGGSPVVIHPGPLRAASTGAAHQCVVLAGGEAECRGANTRGQTGTGSATTEPIPSWQPVAGNLRFSSISGAFQNTCGLAIDARAYCWGFNVRGIFGLGGTVPLMSATPVEVGGGHQWIDLHTRGHSQTCGVTTANVPLCVGHNDFVQVGRLPRLSQDTVLAEWGTGHRLTMIRTEDFHTCGVQTDGAVFCSGRAGAASNTPSGDPPTLPNRIGGTVAFTAIAIGHWHGCGLDAAGSAHCWGYNEKGQLGTGDLEVSRSARPVVGGLTFSRIYALDYSTCGVTTSGETWCWGSNDGGTLGRTGLTMSTVPIRVNIGLGAHSIDRYGYLGNVTTCAVDGSSRLICWGTGQPRS